MLIRDNWKIVRCSRCHLVYVNPVPAADDLDVMYRDFFSSPGPSEKKEHGESLISYYEDGANRIQSYVARGRILDIGCGKGLFLNVMKQKHWDVHGIEPSKGVAAYAEKVGLTIFSGMLQDYVCPQGHFDVVTMWYVMEHLPDPFKALCHANHMLRQGGLLMTRVPNLNFMRPFMMVEKLFGIKVRAISGIDPPRHLHYFSPRTASALIKKSGFSVVGIEHGKPVPLRSYARNCAKHGATASAEMIRRLTGSRWLLGPAIAIYAKKTKDVSVAAE